MIGNDVVDLCDRDADSATFSARFDERVFAPSERSRIAMSADPETCRWRMWSAKEAAYKAARKADPTVIFSPKRFEVRFSETDSQGAEICLGSTNPSRIEVQFFFDGSSVHAVALAPGWKHARVVHGCERVSADSMGASRSFGPGSAARRLALQRLARALEFRRDQLEIRREDRIPVLFENGRPVAGNLSLSHHGEWVAFAFECGVTTGEAAE